MKNLSEYFPPPRFLEMPAVGIDISDFSVKFAELKKTNDGMVLRKYGGSKIPPGIVVSGSIVKANELRDILSSLKDKYELGLVRASLPEEKGYMFATRIPKMKDDDIKGALEFKLEENVPISPSEVIFDYDVVDTADKSVGDLVDVVVSVFPRKEVQNYTRLLQDAGLTPLSLEIEAQATARAIVPHKDTGTYLVVDFGRSRSGICAFSFPCERASSGRDIRSAENSVPGSSAVPVPSLLFPRSRTVARGARSCPGARAVSS